MVRCGSLNSAVLLGAGSGKRSTSTWKAFRVRPSSCFHQRAFVENNHFLSPITHFMSPATHVRSHNSHFMSPPAHVLASLPVSTPQERPFLSRPRIGLPERPLSSACPLSELSHFLSHRKWVVGLTTHVLSPDAPLADHAAFPEQSKNRT